MELVSFGDTERPSASPMFVPIRSGAHFIGTLSIQSYTPNAYTEEDLSTLQALADHCGGALERARATAQLHKSEERYRTISELVSDYVYAASVTGEGQIATEWDTGSLARLTGYNAGELEAHGGWRGIIHPDDLANVKRHWQSTVSGLGSVFEARIITRQGETRWLRTYTYPRPGAEPELPMQIYGAIQDITERKRAEETLLHRQKLESLGVLAGGIAHDFNNLLAAILGNAELAQLDTPPRAPAAQAIAQIQAAAQRAADLTRQMLAYAGKGRFVVQRLDLNTLLTEMTGLLSASISKNVSLQFDLAPHLPPIEADPSQVNQIALNLIVNAAEAIGALPGTITVATRARRIEPADLAEWKHAPELTPGSYVMFEIADTGSGMDEPTRAKIFDPFFTTKFTGRGLGLAAVLGIVRSHRGALNVASEIGQGTTFTILLPAATPRSDDGRKTIDDGAMGERPSIHPSSFILHPSPTVLVIDDEDSVRVMAVRFLERLGFNVLQASDGRAGVEMFEAHADSVACVLLDMTMPQLNGEQALRAIRRVRPDAPVVLMSGYDEHELAGIFADQSVTGFLHKPFRPAELRATLEHALESA